MAEGAHLEKPATKTAYKLRAKLRELSERGIEGERASAQAKLARLESRYDFTQTEQADGPDLFSGVFYRSANAKQLCAFAGNEIAIGSFTKWAIENRAQIPCVWRGPDLFVEAESESLPQLRHIAEIIRANFAKLWAEFSAAPGIDGAERSNFFLGLYDGMMSDQWERGKPLPATHRAPVKRSGKKRAIAAIGLAIHPYNLALELGRKIRLTVPLGNIVAELQSEIARLAA